jgi:hypothetical protein
VSWFHRPYTWHLVAISQFLVILRLLVRASNTTPLRRRARVLHSTIHCQVASRWFGLALQSPVNRRRGWHLWFVSAEPHSSSKCVNCTPWVCLHFICPLLKVLHSLTFSAPSLDKNRLAVSIIKYSCSGRIKTNFEYVPCTLIGKGRTW